MRKAFIFFIFLVTVQFSEAQDTLIDSAHNSLTSSKNDSIRFHWLTQVFYKYLFSTPDSCLPYAQQALLLARQIKSNRLLSGAYRSFGSLYYVIGDYPQALASAQEALKYAERSGYFLSIADCCHGLSSVYNDEGDFEHAIFYAQKGKILIESHWKPSFNGLNDTLHTYFTILQSLGETYEKFNNRDSASWYFQLFNDGYLKANNDKMDWGVIPYDLGNVYSEKGDYSKAIQYYHTGIIISINYGNNTDLIKNYYGIANTYKLTGDMDSSIFYSKKVLEVSRYGYNPIFKLKALNLLTSIYKSQKNIDSLAKYLELTMATKDGLFSQQKIMQFQSMTFNEQIHQQELQQKLEQQKLTNKNRQNVIILVSGLAILIIVAGGLWRRNVYKQRSYSILQKQKQEIDNQKQRVETALEDLKSTQAQLIQSEKMASLGELTAGIAHEIQNPLNFVNNFSEVNDELIDELKEEADKGNINEVKVIADDIKHNLEKINHHGKRADSIVKGMLQHSRASSGQKELTDINKLADEYLRLSYHGMRARDKNFNAEFKTDFDESIEKINVVPQDIGRVLLNLYNNAFYAVNEKSKNIGSLQPDQSSSFVPTVPTVPRVPTVTIVTKKLNNKVEIKVSDNGNGIPQNIVDKIFQPFFTTKPTGQGTGLGLSLAYDIIKAHSGELTVNTKEGEGSEFVIVLSV
jgi:signal transduction histidine kinase